MKEKTQVKLLLLVVLILALVSGYFLISRGKIPGVRFVYTGFELEEPEATEVRQKYAEDVLHFEGQSAKNVEELLAMAPVTGENVTSAGRIWKNYDAEAFIPYLPEDAKNVSVSCLAGDSLYVSYKKGSKTIFLTYLNGELSSQQTSGGKWSRNYTIRADSVSAIERRLKFG